MKKDMVHILKEYIKNQKAVAIATIISSTSAKTGSPGSKMLIFPSGESQGTLVNAQIDQKIIEDARTLLKNEKSKTITYEIAPEQRVDVYIESMVPPAPLIVIGADPDAVPIVKFGKLLGFHVILVDHREDFANESKYPEADQIILANEFEIEDKVPFTERSFVIIKTHNYLKDKEILKQTLKSSARYVGQLGPKERTQDLLKDLAKEGIQFSQQELAKLYGPIGLDLGAETPEQIAVSILAEILAVKNGRAGGFLREQMHSIHPRD